MGWDRMVREVVLKQFVCLCVTHRESDPQHHSGSECVELVHPIDHLALEVLREVALLSPVLRHLVEFLHQVKALHLRSLHPSQLVKALVELRDFNGSIGCIERGEERREEGLRKGLRRLRGLRRLVWLAFQCECGGCSFYRGDEFHRSEQFRDLVSRWLGAGPSPSPSSSFRERREREGAGDGSSARGGGMCVGGEGWLAHH